jgi:hypothetical protein
MKSKRRNILSPILLLLGINSTLGEIFNLPSEIHNQVVFIKGTAFNKYIGVNPDSKLAYVNDNQQGWEEEALVPVDPSQGLYAIKNINTGHYISPTSDNNRVISVAERGPNEVF